VPPVSLEEASTCSPDALLQGGKSSQPLAGQLNKLAASSHCWRGRSNLLTPRSDPL